MSARSESPRLEIEIQYPQSTVTLVRILGAIDHQTAPTLERHFSQIGIGVGFPHVLLDLDGLTFLDQIGLDALLRLEDRVTASAGELHLTPSPSIARMLFEAVLTGASWNDEPPPPPSTDTVQIAARGTEVAVGESSDGQVIPLERQG